MADISQKLEPKGCVTFTGESDGGKAWMTAKHHTSTLTFSLDGIEKAQAERFLTKARADGLEVSDPEAI